MRTEVFEHHMRVGRLAQDAHVRQDAVVDQVVRAESVAAIFLAFEFAPLGLFDFAGNGGDDDVALQLDARALQRLHSVRVADQRALHVVNAEAVDESVLHHGVRLVADAGEKIFVGRCSKYPCGR